MSLTSPVRQRFTNKRAALVVVAAACLGAAGVAVALSRRVPAGAPPARLAPAEDGAQQPRAEVLRVPLRPTGFDPVELTTRRGRTLLAVDDLSGLDEVTLRLDRETGGRLREVKAGRDNSKWRGAFDLHPGLYVLSVAGRP